MDFLRDDFPHVTLWKIFGPDKFHVLSQGKFLLDGKVVTFFRSLDKSYILLQFEDNPAFYRINVELDAVPSHAHALPVTFQRPFLVCPVCSLRHDKIYFKDKSFGCHDCFKLTPMAAALQAKAPELSYFHIAGEAARLASLKGKKNKTAKHQKKTIKRRIKRLKGILCEF